MTILRVRPVDPLRHDVPIVGADGKPTPQFMRQWIAARQVNLTTGDLTISIDELQNLIEQAQALLAALEGRQIIAGDGLSGGGDLSADVTLDVDGTVVRTARQIIAGAGLSGGGDLSADRTVDLENIAGVAGSYGGVGQDVSITVDGQGRITAIADV